MAGGDGNNCKIDKEVTVLPEPDSPTMANVSPLFTLKEIFFTAEKFRRLLQNQRLNFLFQEEETS